MHNDDYINARVFWLVLKNVTEEREETKPKYDTQITNNARVYTTAQLD